MTTTTITAQTESTGPGLRRRVLIALCLTEITSWGILYYAFPVLSVSISADTGWSMPMLTAAFSLGQLAAALTGIPVGRVLDRIGPRTVMTAGSVLAIPALIVVALAPNPVVFFLGWLVAGVAMGAVLYPPAFAALTRWYGTDHVKALMILTLAAGLASTVFAPLTAALVQHTDWRATYLVLTLVLAIITVPGHLFGLRGPWPPAPPPTTPHNDNHRAIARSPAFLALVIALSLGAFAAFAGVFNLVPLLIERGFSPSLAALTLGLGGAGQVLGRLGYIPLMTRTTPAARIVGAFATTAVATALLGWVTTVFALIAVSIGAGLIRGIMTLVQATAITDRWGATHYGRLNGLMSAPVVVVMAAAPFAGTALMSWTGTWARTYLVLAVIAAVAAAIALATIPRTPQHLDS
ncbi:MFS transporter [Nocardia asteroides NBRC 15531]|uniref:Major facilitator superfamily transporter n=1 Tax=Nocardia asteroides NBRC 15531 TaxID=1110697 RepID=U5EA94_NOCAS|nr:MFS transporter [Nocardia asteroides]TLF64187.1 MFS transporter [Nocardia asteroides NBRC 15531]UGT50711.1 MFS transporter [Nocardia asteroides]SFN30154.1 Predicted arabinose efflux permease, MFS family [Nocardia asteroides]VEG36457.1 multidrug efflux system protein MdtL [Nocardia asteroides]GAD83351.1 putative major facilitator superfamily transporter [Nocardia asteroides NBRC 15531]